MLLAPVTALVGLGHNCGEASTYMNVSALLKGAFLLLLEHVLGFIAAAARAADKTPEGSRTLRILRPVRRSRHKRGMA